MTLALPEPVLEEHDGIVVVRDDLVEGGTKVRAAVQCLDSAEEWVYAGPAYGYAQLALAIACEALGKRSVLFMAKRKEPTVITRHALRHGLRVVMVPMGRLSNVNAKARGYCDATGASLIPMGLKLPGMEAALLAVARQVAERVDPRQVWVTAGSGTLASVLAEAFPRAELHAVQVGMRPVLPLDAKLWVAPEAFDQPASGELPPFPSAVNYDAKAWRFVAEHAARDGSALLWNVAGEPPPA